MHELRTGSESAEGRSKGVPDSAEVLERFHSELPLVEAIAVQVLRSVGRMGELDDLVAAGREGLLAAARRFDPTRGVPFGAYANRRVRGAIIDSVRQQSSLPRRAYERLAALEAAALVSDGQADQVFAAGTAPDTSAARRALEEHLSSLVVAATVGMVTEERGETENDGSPEEAFLRAELAQLVSNSLSELDEVEGTLMRRHYFGGEYLDEIARDLDISKSWASRIHARAIDRLRKRLRDLA